MSQLEWLRLLFSVALGAWLLAALGFAQLYVRTLRAQGWRYPFLAGAVFVAVSSTSECAFYAYVIWLEPGNRELTRWALYAIPVALSLQAVAYMLVATWALLGPLARNGSGSR